MPVPVQSSTAGAAGAAYDDIDAYDEVNRCDEIDSSIPPPGNNAAYNEIDDGAYADVVVGGGGVL